MKENNRRGDQIKHVQNQNQSLEYDLIRAIKSYRAGGAGGMNDSDSLLSLLREIKKTRSLSIFELQILEELETGETGGGARDKTMEKRERMAALEKKKIDSILYQNRLAYLFRICAWISAGFFVGAIFGYSLHETTQSRAADAQIYQNLK